MSLMLGDASKGSFTIEPTASGVRFVFKHGTGIPFARFELPNEYCVYVGKQLIAYGNRQETKKILVPGDYNDLEEKK